MAKLREIEGWDMADENGEWQPPEIKLEPGLRAYEMPYFKLATKTRGLANGVDLESTTLDQVHARLNRFLAMIEEQGGEVKGFYHYISSWSSASDIPSEVADFIIVKKD